MQDYVHMMISIPLKYAVSQVVGYIKGESATHIARMYAGRKKDFVDQHFWARGYFASTVGRDEKVIREYIRHQEQEDKRIGQLQYKMGLAPAPKVVIHYVDRSEHSPSANKRSHR